MKNFKKLEEIKTPFKKAVVTIGNFDGVHIGHQSLLHEVIEKADKIGGTSVAITFDPHPLMVLRPDKRPPLITLYEQKAELIEKSGIDVLICIPFTTDFASIPAKSFIEDLLIKKIGMKCMVVGEDYTFGKNREGNISFLKAYSEKLDFEVVITDWKKMPSAAEGRISSTKIRDLVTKGKMVEANKLLGRHYQVRGSVARGRNRGGKLLGFPTANINLHDELCPKKGVYAVNVECLGNTYKGVANIGYSPTFDDHLFTVEVHMMDFDENIYDQKIRVNFVRRIRPELKFSSLEELSDNIREDIKVALQILN
ncbi:MAG: bifunctional riboflavin kinase/FAD synthetase [Desulfobacterales bacterium]|nr:bifunctional riboflavin kinase/FAD synthetase [Desulfobacterales bacterium]